MPPSRVRGTARTSPGVHEIGRAHFANASSGKRPEVRGRPGDILETQKGTPANCRDPWRNMAGCTGLEPVASGVTGSKERVAVDGKTSQPAGATGIQSAVNCQLLSRWGRVWRPRG